MNAVKMALYSLVLLFAMAGAAQSTNCDEGAGPINPASPEKLTTQQIIDQFAAREAVFKQARNNYTFTQDVSIEELDGISVVGEFRLVQDITYDDKGNRIENVTFSPQPTLRNVGLTQSDYEDFRDKMAFVMTTADIPQYNLMYVGQQRVDEVDTYVFDTAPKTIEKGHRYFQGRIWVDNHDLQIVKTCGRAVPQTIANTKKKKNVDENLTPKTVTYREQIDGQFWFPTYTRADDILHFKTGDVRIREVIKYTNYKRFGSTTRIVYKGEAKDDTAAPPPAKKP